MKLTVIVHRAEEGGFWAEVPAIKGCYTQGETMEELIENVREAIAGCLEVLNEQAEASPDTELIEVSVCNLSPARRW